MKYYGIYYGTVVRNTDIIFSEDAVPAGKVLVKIDGISLTNRKSENYSFPLGENISGGIDQENLNLLEDFLIMCDVGHPVIGNDGPGKYIAKANIATVSEGGDSTMWEDASNPGFAPASMFTSDVTDSFGGMPGFIGTSSVNTDASSYSSDYRSNHSGGSFAIPNVGARVLVQFINGNRLFPVITNIVHSSQSFSEMFNAGNNVYPGIPNAASAFVYSNLDNVVTD